MKHIQVTQEEQIATLWLNRPAVRNAFDEEMIAEMVQALEHLAFNEDIVMLVIRGKGKVFSAGADLQWMQQVVNYSYEENIRESAQLQKLFHALYQFPVFTVAAVHKACMGGANGIIAACDWVMAEEQTQFRFSEVKLGLVPATIAPFIMKRTGEFPARALMLTGKGFFAPKALQMGLVDELFAGTPDGQLRALQKEMMENAPQAVRKTKSLLQRVAGKDMTNEVVRDTVKTIAQARVSDEGQARIRQFLEKTK